jgi:hypothetical protein
MTRSRSRTQMERMTRRRARWVVLFDAFRRLVRRISMGPAAQQPTTWLSEPTRVVHPRVGDAVEVESTTSGAKSAFPSYVVLEPTRRESHPEARQASSQHDETNMERRRLPWKALTELDRWDERDNTLRCGGIGSAAWQAQPPPDLATGSTSRDGQAPPDSSIAEFGSDPATWITVGLGDPTYSPDDPRLASPSRLQE